MNYKLLQDSIKKIKREEKVRKSEGSTLLYNQLLHV